MGYVGQTTIRALWNLKPTQWKGQLYKTGWSARKERDVAEMGGGCLHGIKSLSKLRKYKCNKIIRFILHEFLKKTLETTDAKQTTGKEIFT